MYLINNITSNTTYVARNIEVLRCNHSCSGKHYLLRILSVYL